jgi:2-oxoglutarate ferredoxin oxidoreductase subunit beta
VKIEVRQILRRERLPHIWCPGCGLGIVLKAFIDAVVKAGLDPDKMAVVSGIGCTGRFAGYVNVDSYHVTHGRPIPFATGLKLANPELEVFVVSGDGDILSIGGNHFIHAVRRNMDINVIMVNNFIYGMTGGQVAPTTPLEARSLTSPYGNHEPPFNAPYLAMVLGANYVARWTPLHREYLIESIVEAIQTRGFTFIEVVSPCLIFNDFNNIPGALDIMEKFRELCVIDHNPDPNDLLIDLRKDQKIVIGNFHKDDKPSFLDLYRKVIEKAKGGGK